MQKLILYTLISVCISSGFHLFFFHYISFHRAASLLYYTVAISQPINLRFYTVIPQHTNAVDTGNNNLINCECNITFNNLKELELLAVLSTLLFKNVSF